jgi:hypothetical protein
MGYFEAAGHRLTYIAVVAGILYVLCLTWIFMRKSWKRALQIGYTKAQLWAVVKASISSTLIPAIAVLTGFFALAPLLGIPHSWWRLSIVGNTVYELMAANMVFRASGATDLSSATAKEFVLAMYVIAVGIMAGMAAAPFIAESLHRRTFAIKIRDQRWGMISSGVFMSSVLIVFIIPIFFDLSVETLTFITSVVLTLVLKAVVRKYKLTRFQEFSAAVCLLLAMAFSVLWTRLLT